MNRAVVRECAGSVKGMRTTLAGGDLSKIESARIADWPVGGGVVICNCYRTPNRDNNRGWLESEI
jgi:hypothetical protein